MTARTPAPPTEAQRAIRREGRESLQRGFVEQLRRQFGLDRPLYEQLWIYLKGVLTLDLGMSHRQQRTVAAHLQLVEPRGVADQPGARGRRRVAAGGGRGRRAAALAGGLPRPSRRARGGA